MKRILQIVGTMDRAGAETMVMNLYKAIDKSKYQFDFVYFTERPCSYDEEILALGGKIHRIPKEHFNNPIKRTFKLFQLIKRNKPYYAVHCHQLLSNSLHLIAAFCAGISIRVAHAHSTRDFNSKNLIRSLYQKFSKLIISALATDFIACGKEAGNFLFPNKKDITFIPNAIDVKKFIEASNSKENKAVFFNNDQITKNTLVLSQIGRFMPVKNHTFSIKFAEFLKTKGIDFQMYFVGSGYLENDMKKLAEDKNLSNKISFLGIREDINSVLVHTDVMLMPSIYEGFPVILVESQASGTLALISNNISSEVDLGLNLVEFCDLESDFEAWFNKLKFNVNHEQVSAAKRHEILKEKGFDIEVSVKLLEKVYSKS